MVSGLVTSPWDQLRIFSGEARLMRMASKSAIGFPSSNGFERYKLSSYPAGFAVANCRVPRPLRGRRRLPVSIDSPGAASFGSNGGNTPIFKDQSAAIGAAIIGL